MPCVKSTNPKKDPRFADCTFAIKHICPVKGQCDTRIVEEGGARADDKPEAKQSNEAVYQEQPAALMDQKNQQA